MYCLFDFSGRPRRWIDHRPFIKGVSWWRGVGIAESIPDPLEFTLKSLVAGSPDHAPYMGAFIETNPPLWRDDLVEALYELGISNFELYNTAITDPDSGRVYTNYKAVNVLGLVAAADMEMSLATVHDGVPLLDVDFADLVVDEGKIEGIKLFRLAEASNAILVHESLRDELLARGFGSDLAFHNLNEAAI